jgi:hypothetical protein
MPFGNLLHVRNRVLLRPGQYMYHVPTHTRVPKLVFFFFSFTSSVLFFFSPTIDQQFKNNEIQFIRQERERDNIILLRKKKVSLSAAATADLADSRSWALTDFCSMGVFKALDVR